MNIHDIELPAEFRSGNSIPVERATITRERMTEILQDAIEADRQRRGEPVAWRYLTPTGWHATTDAARALAVAEHHTVEPLFTNPQPAEPVKAPSEDERAAQGLPPYNPRKPTEEEWRRLTENGRKAWGKKPSEPVKVPSDEEIEELWQQVHQGIPWMSIRKFARALLARYGQPVEPEGWQLVPKVPTEEMLAATSWPNCAGTDYSHMLKAAPKFGEE